MKKREYPSFRWNNEGYTKTFPIDYTLEELTKELTNVSRGNMDVSTADDLEIIASEEVTKPQNGSATDSCANKARKTPKGIKKVRKFLKARFFPYKRLYNLWGPDNPRSQIDKGNSPPIPLESVPLIKCLYSLSNDPQFQHAFQGTKHSPNQPLPEDVIQEYIRRLSRDLCKNLGDDEPSDDSDFCRHMMFQNRTFKEVILDNLWDQELTLRFNRLRELARQKPSKYQIAALKNCLIAFDTAILELSAVPSRAEKKPEDDLDTLDQLMKLVLSRRKKSSDSKCDEYIVDNCPVDASRTMKTAFYELAAIPYQHKKSKGQESPTECKDLCITDVRHAYLSHLSKSVSVHKFETDYLELQKYLALTSPDMTPKKQYDRVLERCRVICFREIMRCTYAPMLDIPSLDLSTHGTSLIDQLSQSAIDGACAQFRGMTELVSYFYASSYAHQDDNRELQIVSSELLKRYADDSHSSEENILYKVAVYFSEYIQSAWTFLFPEDSPIIDSATHQFSSCETLSNAIWEKAQCAKKFFPNCILPFTSNAEILESLDCYNKPPFLQTAPSTRRPMYSWFPARRHTFARPMMSSRSGATSGPRSTTSPMMYRLSPSENAIFSSILQYSL